MTADDQVPPRETDEQRQLRIEREDSLLERRKQGGELSENERGEVAHRLPPDERLRAEASSLPGSNPLGRARYAKENLKDYETVFATKVRQIKNWIAKGKAATPPELPPLDQPNELAGWWTRHVKQKVPAKLIGLASQKNAQQPGGELATTSIDLTKLHGAAGDALRRAHSVRMAADKGLTDAYASGKEADIEIHQRRWLRAVELERKLEAAAREDAKATVARSFRKPSCSPSLSQYFEVRFRLHREASLFARWRTGSPLSIEELNEIRQLLPSDPNLNVEVFLNRLPARQPDDPCRDYERVFGMKVQQIRNWVAKGKAAQPPELPPLDNLAEMPEWWTRHMKCEVPAKLAALARCL